MRRFGRLVLRTEIERHIRLVNIMAHLSLQRNACLLHPPAGHTRLAIACTLESKEFGLLVAANPRHRKSKKHATIGFDGTHAFLEALYS